MTRSILAAALLAATMPMAYAQHQPTATGIDGPNSINRGSRGVPGWVSGAESQAAANGTPARIIGHRAFCIQAGDDVLRCQFATKASCERANVPGNLICVANPAEATGASPRGW